MNSRIPLKQLVAQIPKTELHVHLEGSMSAADVMLALGEKNGLSLPFGDEKTFLDLCRLSPAGNFSRLYRILSGCIREPADFEHLAFKFARRMHANNIVYAEVTWTPQHHLHKGYPFENWLDAVNVGRQRGKEQFGGEMRWILDILRDDPEEMMQVQAFAHPAAMPGTMVSSPWGLAASGKGIRLVYSPEPSLRHGKADLPSCLTPKSTQVPRPSGPPWRTSRLHRLGTVTEARKMIC